MEHRRTNYIVTVKLASVAAMVIRVAPPIGYTTLALAKKAKIDQLKEDVRYYFSEINNYLDNIEDAKKLQQAVRNL